MISENIILIFENLINCIIIQRKMGQQVANCFYLSLYNRLPFFSKIKNLQGDKFMIEEKNMIDENKSIQQNNSNSAVTITPEKKKRIPWNKGKKVKPNPYYTNG